MHATRSSSCSPPTRSDLLCRERITSLLRLKRARFCFCQSTLFVDNRAQLCSCHDGRLSVSNPKQRKLSLIHRLSELNWSILHIYTPEHTEHSVNAIAYDTEHTFQNVSHDKRLESQNFNSSSEAHFFVPDCTGHCASCGYFTHDRLIHGPS